MYLLLNNPPTEDGVIIAGALSVLNGFFSLAHISVTSYVFDLLPLFLHLISAHLVILTVIFYLFSSSVQLKKVTGMDRA